ncbi:MAG: ABC transporter ATP-binding protein [Clostridia bacterium]|nr:ABC transporter ATP-binding protein [Clostridia bacterium]
MGPRFGPGRRRPLTDEEKAQRPKLTGPLARRILSYLKPYWKRVALVMVIILISAGLGLMPSVLTGRMIDDGLVAGNYEVLVQLVLLSLTVAVISHLINILQSYLNAYIGQSISYDMKNEMYRHLSRMSHRFYTDQPQGELITRMTSDIGGVQSVISNTMTNVLSNVAVLVTTLVAMYRIHWVLATVGVLLLPFFVLPARIVGRYRWKMASKTQEKWDETNQILNETMSVSGQLLVKLFCKEEIEYERYHTVNGETRDLSIKETIAHGWFHMAIATFMSVGPLLMYLVGGILMLRLDVGPVLTVGGITTMVALLNRMFRPVDQLLNISIDVTRSLALFARIFAYLDMQPEIVDRPDAIIPSAIKGDLAFEDVTFAYNADKTTLKNVSFTVASGKTLAIVGASGAGKSTLISLIPRLYDVTGGRVTVDGTDLRDIRLAALRASVGMVTQDTYLFNDTIRANLRYAKEDATEEEMMDACRKANIHDFIMTLPNGYDTVVGNRGLKLSGGEKQRVSLARVILKDPPILVLDEATSSLDSISESQIQDAIRPLLENRTALVVAHRLSTVLSADEILVLEAGEVVARGTHTDLLKASPHYRELYETQFLRPLEQQKEPRRRPHPHGEDAPPPPPHSRAAFATDEQYI